MKVNAMLLQKRRALPILVWKPNIWRSADSEEQFRTVAALEGQRLKSYSRWVLAFRSHLTSEVVRNIEGNLHTLRITQTAEGGSKHPHAIRRVWHPLEERLEGGFKCVRGPF